MGHPLFIIRSRFQKLRVGHAPVGAMNGLTKGAVLAGICYAGFMYDNN
jgi:hypothetical protein